MKTAVPLVLAFCVVLAAPAGAHAETIRQPVVYGDDDRVEVSDHPDELVRTLAESSVVTLVAKPMFDTTDTSDVGFHATTLGNAQNLCDDERFVDQPTPGFCSGTLIAPDLVLTAGHCFASGQASCEQTLVVFGLQWDDELAPITIDQVFACRNVVVHEHRSVGRAGDYTIFQLDRPADDFAPAQVVAEIPRLSEGESFVLIGSPSGLPMKIDDGGRVRDPRTQQGDYLEGTPDTFGGNSGSGVFLPDTLSLFGMLIQGETDYAADGACNRVNRCSESGCGGEKIHYARTAIDDFCDHGTDEVLCGTGSTCGDGFCAWDETPTDCDEDCRANTCGDGICTLTEWSDCDEDCRVTAPAEWTCDLSYYATLDGCDCECGAYDPDCALGQETLRCDFLQTCNDEGKCVDDPNALCECSRSPGRSFAGVFGVGVALLCLVVLRRR